jgi:hypothetical protein
MTPRPMPRRRIGMTLTVRNQTMAGSHVVRTRKSRQRRDSRPQLVGRRVNGDGVGRREDRVGNHGIDGKRTAPFDPGGGAGCRRHIPSGCIRCALRTSGQTTRELSDGVPSRRPDAEIPHRRRDFLSGVDGIPSASICLDVVLARMGRHDAPSLAAGARGVIKTAANAGSRQYRQRVCPWGTKLRPSPLVPCLRIVSCS